MRSYLAICSSDRGRRIPAEVIEAARLAMVRAMPVPADVWRLDDWTSHGGEVALLSWSNEPDPERNALPRPLITGPERALERALGYAGHLAEPKRDEDLLLTTGDLDASADTLGGVFSVFRADAGGFQALTSITRVCPVYYAQAGRLRFAGTRAALVHLTARAAETGTVSPAPDYDVLGMQCMVRHGFYVSDETPFRGVMAVPNAGTLTARVGEPMRVTARALPEAGPMPHGRRRREEAIEPLAETLIAACEPFLRHDRPVRLALSGGRDSRLIAAALHASGIPMVATTHGFADHPDVVLSQRVAGLLGAEWSCDFTEPRPEDQRTIAIRNPILRTYDVVRMCEGMNSGYEGVNRYAPYDPQPRSSGSGGERLRGGFITDTPDLSPEGVRKRLHTIFRAQDELLTPEAIERAVPGHERWQDRARTDGIDVLDKLHMFYRTGRWLAGSHTATLMNWAYYHPFLDARVVRETLRLPVRWRLTEEPVFMLVKRLAPALADVPFDAKRWRFERERPRRPWERAAWKARAPLPPGGATSGFNWRRDYGPEFASVVRDFVLGGPAALWDVVDRKAAEKRLAEVPPGRPSQTWNMLTLSVLLSDMWLGPAPELPSLTVPIP